MVLTGKNQAMFSSLRNSSSKKCVAVMYEAGQSCKQNRRYLLTIAGYQACVWREHTDSSIDFKLLGSGELASRKGVKEDEEQ